MESRLVERVIWASCIWARRLDRVSWISRVAEVTDIILVVKYSKFALFSLNCFERFRDSLFEAIWLCDDLRLDFKESRYVLTCLT